MLRNGYIKLYRNIINWDLWKDKNSILLYITLLLMANVSDAEFDGYHIQRGQVLTSIQKLSEISGLSKMQVRTALKNLEITKTITNLSCPKNRVITIKNYDKFQSITKQITKKKGNKDFNKADNKDFNKADNKVKDAQSPYPKPACGDVLCKSNKVNNKENNKENNKKTNNKIRRNIKKGVSKDTPPKEEKEKIPLPWANSAWKPVIPEGWTEEEYAEYIRKLSR